MENFYIDDLLIIVNKQGAKKYSKVSYIQRYGLFSEIKTPEYVFQFNLNGELRFISGRGKDWPDPSEWLKRTLTGDWVYYSTGGYAGSYDCFGEYYFPCLSYPSNSININDPFSDRAVISAIGAWDLLYRRLIDLDHGHLPKELIEFLGRIKKNPPEELINRSVRLHDILGDNITVLPPDARHVDYDVIPVIIADGCLYKCDFCRVKSRFDFKERSREGIKSQIKGLKEFFGKDISNYNSLFFGQHDALNASADLIEFAATYAFDAFDLKHSNLEGANLFLFGSVDSIINSDHDAFDRIAALPYKTYINVGLESADQETLDSLGKGIACETVERAFAKIIDINRRYENLEITSNFVFGEGLPEGHIKSFFRLMDKSFTGPVNKGSIYFSPLINGNNRDWKRSAKREFMRLKMGMPVPSFLYLIQRL